MWGEARSAPKPASLEVLFAEAKLRITLLDCIQSPNIDLAKSAAMLLGESQTPQSKHARSQW